jgi:hypothetical protein
MFCLTNGGGISNGGVQMLSRKDQIARQALSQRGPTPSGISRRVNVRGPHTTVTSTAANAVIRPVIRGSKYEPWIGNNCQVTFLMVWKTAAAKTLPPVLL